MEFRNEQSQKMLEALHAAGIKSAIVAGGCVRDTLFGKPVKDIDIFIDESEAELDNIATALGRIVVTNYCATYGNIPDVGKVFEVSHDSSKGEVPTQIIAMKDGMTSVERIDTFDFGFCQVGYNGSEVIASENFIRDYNNKTISLVYCEDQKEYGRSMMRYDRLKTKYPEFDLVAKPQSSYPSYIGS